MSAVSSAPKLIGWFRVEVGDGAEGALFAQTLLHAANVRKSWPLEALGACIVRRTLAGCEEFLFSPHAACALEDLMRARRAVPCLPPRARELVPARTSRLVLGFATRWEPFAAAHLPAQGVPRPAPEFEPLQGPEHEEAARAIARFGHAPGDFVLRERRAEVRRPGTRAGIFKLIVVERVATGHSREYSTAGEWITQLASDLRHGVLGPPLDGAA